MGKKIRIAQRVRITLTLEVDLDPVPGWGHEPQDWVALTTREFLRQEHYGAELISRSVELIK